MKNLRLVNDNKVKKTTFKVGQVEVGKDFLFIAGPCSIESEEQLLTIAHAVKKSGSKIFLRGGAF